MQIQHRSAARRALAMALGIGVGALALGGCQSAPERLQAAARTPVVAPKDIRTAQWVNLPTGSEIAALYPPKAVSDKVSGFAVVHCRVLGSGELSHCEPTVESPAGFGFADATVRMSHYFRLAAGPYAPDAALDIPFAWKLR